MKYLILGANGMLGSMMVKYLSGLGHQVAFTTRTTFNPIKDKINSLKEFEFDYIINAIGVIKPFIEKNVSESIYINSYFPHILSSTYVNKVIHITTDCVFSGNKGNYIETDLHDAIDLYGRSKSLGEPFNAMVIRTSIIGPEVKNPSVSLLEWALSQKNNEVNGFINHFWNGITTLELSKVIEKITVNNKYSPGIQHVYGEIVSKYGMLACIRSIYGLSFKLNPTKTDKLDRSLSSLNKSFINELDIHSFAEQIKELKEFNVNP